MAARTLRPRHTEEIRRKIQASQIINRLQDHIDGKVDMSTSQVQCARILLGKSVPDLSSVEHVGEDGGAIKVDVTLKFK